MQPFGALMTNILITGANGYIGKHLACYLAQRDHFVTAVTRRQQPDAWLNHPNIKQVISSEITNKSDALFVGAEVVIHAAGHAHKRGKKGQSQRGLFRQDNVELALNVVRCAQKNGVRRMIFLSSIGAALLEADLAKNSLTLEKAWLTNPYRASKLVAERELASFVEKTDNSDVVILRLPMVYGKDAPGNFHTLSRAIQKRIPLPFASIKNKRAFVAIETLCDFIALCLDHPRASGVLALRDANEISTPDFIRSIAVAGGYPNPILFPCPPEFIRMAGHLLGLSQTMESLLDSLHIDIKPLQEILGWAPQETITTAMYRSFDQKRPSN